MVGAISTFDGFMQRAYWPLNGLIPPMTNNTTPSGIASSNINYNPVNSSAYHAFAGNNSFQFQTTGSCSNAYSTYQFSGLHYVYGVQCVITPAFGNISSITLQGSNDGVTWTTLTGVSPNSGIQSFHNSVGYSYYQLDFNGVSAYCLGGCGWQIYGI